MKGLIKSTRWKTWKAMLDLKTCLLCRRNHGKIYGMNDWVSRYPPLHPNCRCVIEALGALLAGMATNDGQAGADWWLKNLKMLPGYYISKQDALALGWDKKTGNLGTIAPGMMIGGEIYWNSNGKLPSAPGRVWYEVDINYSGGWRNDERILFSNDGLIFVTYNHYITFIEIV